MKGITRAKLTALTVSFAALALCFEANAKTPAIYTVAKVAITADADNAVAAKEKALAQAQVIALRKLLKRLTGWNSYSHLPILPDDMVERMVEGFAVRRESNSSTRYIASLDFTFEPNAVRDILNRFGLPYTDQQAARGLLIPIMIEGGAARQGSKNPWYEAFSEIDTEHALTPLKLAVPGTNLSASMVSGLSASSRGVFETLTYQYRSENLILAAAEVDAQATKLHMRLLGRDAVGGFAIERNIRIYDRDIASAAGIAASTAVKIIEGRWKTTRLASQGALEGPADLQTVAVTAQFSGLRAWRAMHARLKKVPGVQNVNVKALNARGANLTIDFPGGAKRLTQAAQSQGLSLEERAGQWLLVAR